MHIVDSLARIKTLITKIKVFTGNTPIFSHNKIFSPINIDQSKHVHLHIDGDSLDKFKNTPEAKELEEQVQKYIAEDGQYIFSNTDNAKNLNKIASIIYDSSKKQLLDFINTSIPRQDRGLWISGLVLRDSTNREEVGKIKMDMIYTAGHRGKNIANLCKSEYLESKIIPLHEKLITLSHQDGEREFLSSYSRMVNYPVFAVFVGASQSQKEVLEEIRSKIQILLGDNGQDQIDIHGINNSNVRKIKTLLPEIIKEFGKNIARHSVQDSEGFIKVQIFLRSSTLPIDLF